jgi:hypothetical protein
MLQLKMSYPTIPGEDPNVQLTGTKVLIDANGGTGAKVLIKITQTRVDGNGDALADVDYEFYGAAAKDADLGSAANAKDFVDLINANGPDNILARIAHAPQDATVNSDAFDDQGVSADLWIPADGQWVDCLHHTAAYVDANSDQVMWMRLGLPEIQDMGFIRLLGISGNSTGVTNGIVTLYRDEPGLAERVLIQPTTLAAAQTDYLDLDTDKGHSLQTPLILEVRSDDLSAADFLIRYQTGEI